MKWTLLFLALVLAACDDDGPSREPARLRNKIVFISDRDGYPQLYVMNTDGTGVKLLPATQPGSVGLPAVSPNGRQIAFVLNGDIWLMNADATGQVNLTNNPAYEGYPSWSPDGRRLAFSSDRDGHTEIYVMNADGSNPVNLTNDPGFDGGSSWSPDGTNILFTTDRDGNTELYVMDSDGSNPTNLSNNPEGDALGVYSHDGLKIAFVSGRDQFADRVYMMTSDGGSLRLDVPDAPAGGLPSWSPDDSRIAFTGGSTNAEIVMMLADGMQQANLTNNSAEDRDASWSP
ncbi:MAG: hypothetical protein ABI836_03845 [Gemmatimonadota bacterium]